MLDSFRYKIAVFIAPSLADVVHEQALALAPKLVLENYQCKFYAQADEPEDGLTNDERTAFLMWAYQNIQSPWFTHLIRWCIDTQANWALRHAANDRQADFSRATINALETFEDGVERLASIHQKEQGDRLGVNDFDKFSTGINE